MALQCNTETKDGGTIELSKNIEIEKIEEHILNVKFVLAMTGVNGCKKNYNSIDYRKKRFYRFNGCNVVYEYSFALKWNEESKSLYYLQRTIKFEKILPHSTKNVFFRNSLNQNCACVKPGEIWKNLYQNCGIPHDVKIAHRIKEEDIAAQDDGRKVVFIFSKKNVYGLVK